MDLDAVLLVFDQFGILYFEPPFMARSVHQLRRDIRLRLREILDPRMFRMIAMLPHGLRASRDHSICADCYGQAVGALASREVAPLKMH